MDLDQQYGWPEIFTGCIDHSGPSTSTLTICSWRWLKERYVAIKINAKKLFPEKGAVENELAMLRRISQTNPKHQGWHLVRKLVDSFEIEGSKGKHPCLVFEPLREPLWLYCKRFVDGVIPFDVLKIILQMILQGLDYLHSECQIIHTGKRLNG